MINIIVISSIAATVGIAVQVLPRFRQKVILRRIYASVALIAPCLLSLNGNPLSSYIFINSGDTRLTLISSAIFSVLVILVTVRLGKQSGNTDINPQIRIPRWTLSLFTMNVLSWMLYLIAYEFLFRGYLFTSLLQHTSMGNAFIISVVLYALAHLHKDEREFLLSIPFGIMLCYITYLTANVWAAVSIHCTLAISNDVFAFRANPFFSISFPAAKKFRYEK